LTVAATVTSTPASSSGTTTGLVNLQPSSATSAPSVHSATARAASAIVNMPWAITPGRPTEVATRSDQWIGLKSPLAPA
jgi:phage portal protein BeeE